MEIGIASDHAGYALKQYLKKYLEENNYNIIDYGTNSEESVDYPDYGKKLAQAVVDGDIKGIAVCGSGIGISIAANKVDGARAALVHDEENAKLARQHNDANIICLAGRQIDFDEATKVVEAFLQTEFEGGRHQKRVNKIHEIEN